MIARRTRERELHRKGFLHIAGVDEVGRGALAGPLVAAAIIFPPDVHVVGVRDSKLLTQEKRESLFPVLTKKALAWSIGIISHEDIDARGIQEANRRAFAQALDGLRLQPEYLLFDWLAIEWRGVPNEAVIGGDRKLFSVAAASIIAKVWRDRFMVSVDSMFPKFGFARHKGYGTPFHYQRIERYGVSAIHRKRFLDGFPVLH